MEPQTINETFDEALESPSSALAISCCVMTIIGACVLAVYLLVDRYGMARAAGVSLALATFPLACWMFSERNGTVSLKEIRWRRWGVIGLWVIYSFFILLATQRFFIAA